MRIKSWLATLPSFSQVGDRIMCVKMFGLWTEFATVSQESCFTIPSDMSYEEAAAIPVNYVTAYHMLFELGNLRKGSSVLIHMAAGKTTREICSLVLLNPVYNLLFFYSVEKINYIMLR